MVFVVRGGGFRRMDDRFLFKGWEGWRGVEERRVRRERLCASVRERRSVARRAAVTSGEGGSPKMKNLMNAPIRITMESWPRRRPCVKERLVGCELGDLRTGLRDSRGFGLGEGHILCSHFGDLL